MEKKIIVRRILSLSGALFFLLFGANLGSGRFCLGDWILTALGLPAWSKGNQGLHYPGFISLVGLVVCFYFFSATTKDPRKTTASLILGSILLMMILNFLLNLL